MYGTIIGDIAGSTLEVREVRSARAKIVTPYDEKMKIMDKNMPLFPENSSCTDDSILTTAIADAIMSGVSYEVFLRSYGLKELELGEDIYNRGRFGKGFVKWLLNDSNGDSFGNGCAMRISPVGYLFDTLEEVKEESMKATIPSHNHIESITASEAVAVSILMLRNGKSKEEVRNYIVENYYPLDYDLESLRREYKFSSFARNSVPQALFCFFESNDFEDAIRIALSIGGDSDTIAAITGSIAEACYGVPENLKEMAKPYLKDYMVPVIDKFYKKEKGKVYEKTSK